MFFLVFLASIEGIAAASITPQATPTFMTLTSQSLSPRQIPGITSIDPRASACSAVTSSYSSCIFPQNLTQAGGINSITSRYQCLCNSTTTMSGQPMPMFDAEVSMCADFAVTGSPSLYSSIANLEGYCIRTISGETTTRETSIVSRTMSVAPTGTTTNAGNDVKDGIQNFTAGQIAGVSIGCASAVALGALACCVGIRKKRRGAQAPSGFDIPEMIVEEPKDMEEISVQVPSQSK
ncbi:hypothetical protein B0J14DRAFT_651027 [Halenospora varia]|nr:hypothetical protein B0J14DRAFT_651027 [Halenospora varia]